MLSTKNSTDLELLWWLFSRFQNQAVIMALVCSWNSMGIDVPFVGWQNLIKAF